jgi:hypothetical protein
MSLCWDRGTLQSGIRAHFSTLSLDGLSWHNVEVEICRELIFGVCLQLVLLNYCSKIERKFMGNVKNRAHKLIIRKFSL